MLERGYDIGREEKGRDGSGQGGGTGGQGGQVKKRDASPPRAEARQGQTQPIEWNKVVMPPTQRLPQPPLQQMGGGQYTSNYGQGRGMGHRAASYTTAPGRPQTAMQTLGAAGEDPLWVSRVIVMNQSRGAGGRGQWCRNILRNRGGECLWNGRPCRREHHVGASVEEI